MYRYLFLCASLALPFSLAGQVSRGDSLLAAERSVDRPITVHAHQLRIAGSHALSLVTRRFDLYAEPVRSKDEGISSVRNRFSLDVKYGIHEFIQLNAGLGYAVQMVREDPKYILPPDPEPAIAHKIVREHRGVEDLYVGVDLRAPLRTRKIDLALTLGTTIPLAPFEPEQPDHGFAVVQRNSAVTHQFTYHYHCPYGKGVAVAQLGGMIKYRRSAWAIAARVDYQHALKDVASYEWQHQLNDGTYEYRKHPITYRLPDANTYYVEGEYQLRRRLVVSAMLSGYTAFNGWSSSQPDVKIASLYQTTWVLSPGLEIVVTPRLWVRERLTFPLAGKNIEAPFGIHTAVVYNLFPTE